MADALWPEALPDSWAAGLRGVITDVRRYLEEAGLDPAEVLTTARRGYQLRLLDDVVVDLDEARNCLVRARALLDARDGGGAAAQAARAAGLARLPFLPNHGGVADQGFLVAVALYAHAQGGAALLGAVALAQMVLAALAAPLFGRQAQRRSCRAVLWGAASVQAGLMLLTAALAAGGAPVAAVVAVAIAGAVASGAARPVRFALLPWLATSPKELESANVASSTSEGLSYFAGPALAGFAVAVHGPAAANAYRLPAVPAATADGTRGRLADGFQILFRQASTITVLAVTQTFVRGLLNVLIVVAALELLRTGDSGVALLQAVIGVGGMLGALVVASAARGDGHAPRLALALFCWGTPLAFIGLVPHTGVAVVALTVVGIANVAVDVNAVTLLQRLLPGDSAARAFSSLECLFRP